VFIWSELWRFAKYTINLFIGVIIMYKDMLVLHHYIFLLITCRDSEVVETLFFCFLFQVALATLGTLPLEPLVGICTALVSYGCHVHAAGLSPLHDAVSHSSSVLAALLSAREKYPDTVSKALEGVDVNSGNTPLHTATQYGYVHHCQLLIDAGADVNAVRRDAFGKELLGTATPLELAVVRNKKDIVQVLLQSPSCQVDKLGSQGATALWHATLQGASLAS